MPTQFKVEGDYIQAFDGDRWKRVSSRIEVLAVVRDEAQVRWGLAIRIHGAFEVAETIVPARWFWGSDLEQLERVLAWVGASVYSIKLVSQFLRQAWVSRIRIVESIPGMSVDFFDTAEDRANKAMRSAYQAWLKSRELGRDRNGEALAR